MDAYSTRILPLIFESLVNIGPDGDVRPGLAASWEIDEAGTTYRFALREAAKFSDGAPLTVDDVVANLDYLRDPANKSPAAGALEPITDVRNDGGVLIIELSHPYAPFLVKLARGIVPAAKLDDPAFGDAPVGSGPYRVARFARGSAIELVPNPHYAGPAPTIARVRFEVISDETTRMLKMKNGDLDLLQNCTPPYALKHFARLPGIAVDRAPGINYSYLGFNLDDPFGVVNDARVRRAIAHAIDRTQIIDTLLKGQAREADGLLAPENWAHADGLPTHPYSPERARALLDESGHPDPDGDGPRPRFTLSYKTSTDRLRNRIAEVIARQLADVGIALEKRSFEWGTFFADIKSGNFQTYTLTWVGVTDPDHLFYVFHSSMMPPAGANRGRYSNARVDDLLEAARIEQDRAKRRALYADAQRQIAKDVVYVDLWWAENIVVRRTRLEGFVPYPGGEYTSLSTARLMDEPSTSRVAP
ncbi:MAG: ABC transporter substrate-binding protein [Deltaproteobacteria bacterium]|nr:ABC transporter substrate-binding protein [Deltaproteobacteria bacterium]